MAGIQDQLKQISAALQSWRDDLGSGALNDLIAEYQAAVHDLEAELAALQLRWVKLDIRARAIGLDSLSDGEKLEFKTGIAMQVSQTGQRLNKARAELQKLLDYSLNLRDS